MACWGYNGDGQLGDGIPEDCMGPPHEEACSTTPVEVEGVTDATEVAAGAYHSCAVLTTGHVDCWGSDGVGELGDDGPWSDVPRKVLGILAPPAAVTGRAGTVTNTSATVSATAYPGGVEVSGCEFEYGTTRSYGSSVPCSSAPGSGEEPVPVGAALSGSVGRHDLPLPDIRNQRRRHNLRRG